MSYSNFDHYNYYLQDISESDVSIFDFDDGADDLDIVEFDGISVSCEHDVHVIENRDQCSI